MIDKSVRRVGAELEAAEALAALSHHIISSAENESGTFGQPFKNANKSLIIPHDGSEISRKNTNTNRMSYRVLGSGSCTKSRNHLTEDEREQRRIRRVLANRESARETIRRRQAMHDELIENAAVLEMENGNLKTEKKQALSKFSSLKSMNERLQDMLEAAKAEAKKEQCGDPDLLTIKQSPYSNTPTLPSVVPFFWLPFSHSPDIGSEQVVNWNLGTDKQIAEEPRDDDMVEMEALSPSAWGLATKSEIPIHCPSKKSSGAAAAAEARRRRKELTNLKKLYCRNRLR